MTKAFAFQMSWLEQRQDFCHSNVHGSLACDAHRWRIASPFRFLATHLSLLGAIVETFRKPLSTSAARRQRTTPRFTLDGRWTSVETASALLRSTLTTANALRPKSGVPGDGNACESWLCSRGVRWIDVSASWVGVGGWRESDRILWSEWGVD